MLARVGHRAARPQRPDDLNGLLEHLVAQPGKWSMPADYVFVEILACTEAEGEPPSDSSCMVAAFCATTAG